MTEFHDVIVGPVIRTIVASVPSAVCVYEDLERRCSGKVP